MNATKCVTECQAVLKGGARANRMGRSDHSLGADMWVMTRLHTNVRGLSEPARL
jgi:hypothetical protein